MQTIHSPDKRNIPTGDPQPFFRRSREATFRAAERQPIQPSYCPSMKLEDKTRPADVKLYYVSDKMISLPTKRSV